MTHNRSLATILAVVVLAATRAIAIDTNAVIYVSPATDTAENGTIQHPFDSVREAYGAACASNGTVTVQLLPGIYTESGTLVHCTNKILLKGTGPDQVTLQSLMVFVSNPTYACAISGLSIAGVFTNTSLAYLHDVRLPFIAKGYTNIVGMWREDMASGDDQICFRGLAMPFNPTDAASKEYADDLTNSVILQGDDRYYMAGAPIDGSLVFSPTGESNTLENMSLQQVGSVAVLWFPQNGAFNVKEKNQGGTGDRFSVQSQIIYAFRTLDMRGYNITNLASPTVGSQAANKTYVDTATNGVALSSVKKSGDTMTGTLTVPGLNVSGNWVIGSSNQLIVVNNNGAGVVTGWSSGTDYAVTNNLGITGTYAVIITPTSDPGGSYYVSAKAANSFTVTLNAGASPFSFDYLIIRK